MALTKGKTNNAKTTKTVQKKTTTVIKTSGGGNSKRINNPTFGFVTDFLVKTKAPPNIITAWSNNEKEFIKHVRQQDRKSGGRKKKDPNAPKKAKSAYIFFCNDKREDIKKKNPDAKSIDIVRRLGEEWKGLSDKNKKKYIQQAEKDKERFADEMTNYSPPEEYIQPKKKKRNTGRSGYLIFCTERRPEVKIKNPDLKGKEILTLLGNEWTNLPEKQKVKFNERSRKEKEEIKAAAENSAEE